MKATRGGTRVESVIYRRAAELLEADINDELVALEPNQGACFGFNAVARDVWRKLEQPLTFDQLRGQLLAEYDVSEQQCNDDLRNVLSDMTRLKLIEEIAA